MIDHRRHAVVRVHLQKFGRELIAALDVAGDDLVLKPAFLQQDGDFLAVGGRPVMQIEHRKTPALLRASDSPRATLPSTMALPSKRLGEAPRGGSTGGNGSARACL